MPVKYALFRNFLRNRRHAYRAVVQGRTVRTEKDLFERITSRGGNVNKAEVLAAIEEYEEATEYFLKQGDVVRTRLFYFYFTIQGEFDSLEDRLKPDGAQKLVIKAKLGDRLKGLAEKIPTQRVEPISPQPVIKQVYDWSSNTESDTLTPRGALEISGELLKLTDESEDDGVYFIQHADQSETKALRVIKNLPSNLMVIIPPLTAGNYTLQIRTRYTKGGDLLNRPRIGVFNKTLVVPSRDSE